MDCEVPEEEEAVAATFKVLMLGSSEVGKTSLIQSYATGKRSNSRPTLGKEGRELGAKGLRIHFYMLLTCVLASVLPCLVGVDFTNIVVSVRGVKVRLRVW